MTATLAEAVELANRIAPEHLELAVRRVPSVGCRRSAMPARSFSASTRPKPSATTSPVRTTCCRPAASARFSSPLGVYDFIKRSSVIAAGPRTLAKLGPAVARLARLEGLDAHARAVERRLPSRG